MDPPGPATPPEARDLSTDSLKGTSAESDAPANNHSSATSAPDRQRSSVPLVHFFNAELTTVALVRPSRALPHDVRELLWCVAEETLPLLHPHPSARAGRPRLAPAARQRLWPRLPSSDPSGRDGATGRIVGLDLLVELCEAGQLVEPVHAGDRGWHLQLSTFGWQFLSLAQGAQVGFVFAAWWEGVDWARYCPVPALGHLLQRERHAVLSELAWVPPATIVYESFARRMRAMLMARWPELVPLLEWDAWCQQLWSLALAPLAMLGALDTNGHLGGPPPGEIITTMTTGRLLGEVATLTGPPPGELRYSALAN